MLARAFARVAIARAARQPMIDAHCALYDAADAECHHTLGMSFDRLLLAHEAGKTVDLADGLLYDAFCYCCALRGITPPSVRI